MGPLEFTDGEVIVATLQPCLNSLDLEVHPLKCGEFRLPKCYQKVADASFGKDCTVQAHMSRTLQMQTQVFLRKVPGNFHVAENAFNEYSFLKKASNVNVIRMWDAFIATDGESKECEVVTVFETMDVTLEKFLKDFGRLGDLNYCDYFLCNVAMGLHYIHAAGVAHGDICPANVWLNRNDDVKLAGFQHLHPADPAPPDSSAEFFDFATKSIQYAAPEVLRKESFGGAQADLFGLGCILVDFLLKRKISPGRSVAEQLDILQNRERILEDSKVPSNRKSSLQTLWEENPGRRGTATEFIKSGGISDLYNEAELEGPNFVFSFTRFKRIADLQEAFGQICRPHG